MRKLIGVFSWKGAVMWNLDYIQNFPPWLKLVILVAGLTILVVSLVLAPEQEDDKPLDEKSKT